MIRHLTAADHQTIRDAVRAYPGLYDGQFNGTAAPSVIEDEFVTDVCSSLADESIDGWYWADKSGGDSILISHFLDWDSALFGLRMERLDYLVAKSVPARESLLEIYLENAISRDVKHISVRVPASELDTVRSLSRRGFEFMGSKAMLRYLPRQPLTGPNAGDVKVDRYVSADEGSIVALARSNLEHNRFLADEHLDHDVVPDLYQKWLEPLISNVPEGIIVARADGKVCGFVALTEGIALYDKRTFGPIRPGFISLCVLDRKFRNKGIGTNMLFHAVKLLQERGCDAIFANTAQHNSAGLLAFQRAGFVVFSNFIEMRLFSGGKHGEC